MLTTQNENMVGMMEILFSFVVQIFNQIEHNLIQLILREAKLLK